MTLAAWLWLTTLLSLALFVFIVISGGSTPSKISYAISSCFYGVATVASVLGLLGAIQLQGTGETYLFSLFGIPVHEGFRVTMVTSVLTLCLYALSFVYTVLQARRSARIEPNRAHGDMLQLSWATFGLSLLILSPTLGQAVFGLLICILGAVWSVKDITMVNGDGRWTRFSILIIGLVISFVLQTDATWVAWRDLHTVQLDQINPQGGLHSLGRGHPTVTWLWFIGLLLQVGVCVFCRLWSGQMGRLGAQLRLVIVLGVMSGLYVWLAWPVVVTAPWMLILVIIAGLLAAAAVLFVLYRRVLTITR